MGLVNQSSKGNSDDGWPTEEEWSGEEDNSAEAEGWFTEEVWTDESQVPHPLKQSRSQPRSSLKQSGSQPQSSPSPPFPLKQTRSQPPESSPESPINASGSQSWNSQASLCPLKQTGSKLPESSPESPINASGSQARSQAQQSRARVLRYQVRFTCRAQPSCGPQVVSLPIGQLRGRPAGSAVVQAALPSSPASILSVHLRSPAGHADG
ncbi:unnamed protein product [Arctogadus glacialis]